MKPFIKCPGGKTKLCTTLFQNLPKDFDSKYNYIEPFLGGGAFFLNLLTKDPSLGSRTTLNDFNHDTWNVWQQVRQNPDQLIDALKQLKVLYSKEHFLAVRKDFEEYTASKIRAATALEEAEYLGPAEYRLDRAAKFIYLNKTCFNGLIRYNKSGHFNAPFGYYKNPGIFDADNIRSISRQIAHTRIFQSDFEELFKVAELQGLLNKKTFTYLDPPYIPRSLTANFTEYSKDGFTLTDHERLKALVDTLTSLGVKVLLSNSDTVTTRALYKNYNILEVTTRHLISCQVQSRGVIKELLIRNY